MGRMALQSIRHQDSGSAALAYCRRMQTLQGAMFGLSGDVKRVHRLVKVCQQDLGLLAACRIGAREEEFVWLNSADAFGISSAAYHW